MIRRAKNLAHARLDNVSVRVGDVYGIGGDCRRYRTIRLHKEQSAEAGREVSLTLGECGHSGRAHSCDLLSRSLVVAEEKGLVLDYWSTQDEAILIASKDGFSSSRGREEVARIQCFVAQKLESGSVKIVCARLRRQVNDAAVEAAELSRRTVNFNFEFLNSFDDRKERNLTRFGFQNGNAVEQVLVRSRTTAVDAWE